VVGNIPAKLIFGTWLGTIFADAGLERQKKEEKRGEL
jgi:hypothetical protein